MTSRPVTGMTKDTMDGISPLPWKVNDWGREEYLDGVLCRYAVKPIAGYSISYIHEPKDAAYIVHACNLYPELVEALEAIVKEYPVAAGIAAGFERGHGSIKRAATLLAKCKTGVE